MDEFFFNPSMRKAIFKPIDLLYKIEYFDSYPKIFLILYLPFENSTTGIAMLAIM